MGIKLKESVRGDTGEHWGWQWWCPACKCGHVATAGWTFSGTLMAPTFTPSFAVTYKGDDADTPDGQPSRCHTVVTEGRIHYQADCSHAMAGLVVDLPDWPHP